MDTPTPSSRQVLAVAVAFEGGLGLLALALGQILPQPPAAAIAWTWRSLVLGLAASLPLVGVLVLVTKFPIGPLGRLMRLVDAYVVPIFLDCGWFDFLLVSLLAGFGEELFFRGVVQQAVSGWSTPAVGLLVASALFALAHPLSIGYALLAGLYGIYLGLVWMLTGNLLVVIMAHAVYDFLALVYLVRPPAADQ